MCEVLPIKLTTRTNVDIKTECLLFGYIREIGIKNKIIPSTTLHLCIIFYSSKRTLVCISKSGVGPPIIDICLFDQQKYCATTVLPLDENINVLQALNEHTYNSAGSRSTRNCYVSDFELPTQVLQLNKALDNINNKYAAIFTVSKYNDCAAYIVDINNSVKYQIHDVDQIEVYDWNLPKIYSNYSRTYEEYSGSMPLYSSKHGLICIGGLKTVHSFLFWKGKEKCEIKWKPIATFSDKRYRSYGTAAMFTDDTLIYCGGRKQKNVGRFYDESYVFSNKVDMLNVVTNKWTTLKPILGEFGRSEVGIYVDNSSNKRVFIGGGKTWIERDVEIGCSKFDYLDVTKNKWISLCDTNYLHKKDPIIWMDVADTIYIASTHAQVFERMDLRENKWNVEVDSKQFNDLFGGVKKRGSKLFM